MGQDPDLSDVERRMQGSVDVLHAEFSGLRAGRASASLIEPITVEAYGSQMPLNQVGTISVPEARMLSIQVWDKTMVAKVDKAIRMSGLGLNPIVEGQLLRIPIPELNEERRVELTKIASRYGEQARVAVRNVRRDGMELLKRMEKEHEMSQDEHKLWADEVQDMTNSKIEEIDRVLAAKEEDILRV